MFRLPIRLFGHDSKVSAKEFFLFSYGTEKKPVLVKRLKRYFNDVKRGKINYENFYKDEQSTQEMEKMNTMLKKMIDIKYGDNNSISTPLQLKDAYVKDKPNREEKPVDESQDNMRAICLSHDNNVQNNDNSNVGMDDDDEIDSTPQEQIDNQLPIPRQNKDSDSGERAYGKWIVGAIITVGGLGGLYYAFTSKKGNNQVKKHKASKPFASQGA